MRARGLKDGSRLDRGGARAGGSSVEGLAGVSGSIARARERAVVHGRTLVVSVSWLDHLVQVINV
jgi:hypothetical protein